MLQNCNTITDMTQNDSSVSTSTFFSATSIAFLAEAEQAHDELLALGEEHANTWSARQLRQDIAFAQGQAQTHALLAIAQAIPRPPVGPKVVHL